MTLKAIKAYIKTRRTVIIPLALVCLGQLIICGFILFISVTLQMRQFLADTSTRVQEDIHYKNGTWDTSAYDTDPEVPGNYRLYVIAKDGYVIDRWRPINGYLNTSDLKYLLAYQQPSTVKAITGQSWRILTLPIKTKSGDTLGGIAVGSYNLTDVSLETVDNRLKETAEKLLSDIHIRSDDFDVTNINAREVPVGISFQIIDRSNLIRLKSDTASSIDRLPNYIDPSYITKELGSETFKALQDTTTSEIFMAHTAPIADEHGNAVGTIIVARTVSPNLTIFEIYLGGGSLVSIVLIATALWFYERRQRTKPVVTITTPKQLALEDIKHIRFVKGDSVLQINDIRIPITYATNQYYMCQLLFGAPKKKWAADELLDKFGETNYRDGWRKVYDAMTSINKKVAVVTDTKLIVTSNKTYQINPVLITKIKRQQM